MSGVRARCRNFGIGTLAAFKAHRQRARDMEGLATGAVLILFLRRRDVALFASSAPAAPVPAVQAAEIDGR